MQFACWLNKARIHKHTHTQTHTHTHTNTHTHTYTNTYTHTNTHTQIHTHKTHTNTNIHTQNTHIHTQTHTNIHIYTHKHTHTHTLNIYYWLIHNFFKFRLISHNVCGNTYKNWETAEWLIRVITTCLAKLCVMSKHSFFLVLRLYVICEDSANYIKQNFFQKLVFIICIILLPGNW